MTATGPEVSVCMPVFNAGAYLEPAIDSILRQTFRDFEFLILDDASTDDSLSVANRYAARDSRIRVSAHEHKGYPNLLNEGLGIAGGRFFARMDADDLVLPERLARQLEYLNAHEECVAVGSQVVTIDAEGLPVDHTTFGLSHDDIDERQLGGRYQMHHPSLVFRADAIRSVGGYRPEFEPAEDYDLLLRLAEVGKLANVPERLYHYRMHADQVTVRKYEIQQRHLREAQVQACRRRGIVALPPPAFVHPRPAKRWQQYVVWSECASRAGYPLTARKYARKALALRPWSRTAWKTFVAASAG